MGVGTKHGGGDLTNNALGGSALGLLLIGVLGVLTMTSEYTSGMIRATLAAIPNRPLILAAKAAVFGGVALVVGEAASFASFIAGTATLKHGVHAPTLGQPGVLRAVVLSGAGYCLVGLIGVGLGAIIRHTAAAVAVLVGGVYVPATAVSAAAHSIRPYITISIVANSMTTTKPLPSELSPWAGFGMLCLYSVVALGVGGWLLIRRDA